ncbi:MAG: protein mraZ [Bacteroidales bacterium]|nr:protein mraZ [Bacteroidales bacterium]
MSTFIGDFNGKADAKGRIVLPVAFKHELENMGDMRLIVKKDLFEPCLLLYPYNEWERIMDDLRTKINSYDREHTRFLREYQRNTAELQVDNFSRILLPRRLLQIIGADKQLTFLGVDKHIEVWDSDTYDSQAMSAEDLALLAEKILGSNSRQNNETR